MKCHLLEHELCTFCNDGRETIIHLFWECTHSQTIWICLINSINENYNITLERRPEFFILGFPYEVKLSGLHLLILLIKKFIALSRQYNKVPDWNSCKNFIVSYKKLTYTLLIFFIQKRRPDPTKMAKCWKNIILGGNISSRYHLIVIITYRADVPPYNTYFSFLLYKYMYTHWMFLHCPVCLCVFTPHMTYKYI